MTRFRVLPFCPLRWLVVATYATSQLLWTSFATDDATLREEALAASGILPSVPAAALNRHEVTLGQALFWDPTISQPASCRSWSL